MNPRWLAPLLVCASPAAFDGVGPVWAGTFKCQQPDGGIVYQAIPCAAESQGTELELDTRPPSGGEARGKGKDYSIESQLKAMEAERRKALKAQDQAGGGKHRSAKAASGPDAAKCAKQRAEVARWRHRANAAYRDQSEKEYKEQTLEYHQALVDRYCKE